MTVNISSVAERGCIVGIFGPVGSGKTTLLDRLVGHIRESWQGPNLQWYGKEYNIPLYVHAPKKTLDDDYRNEEKFPNLRRGRKTSHVPITRQRLRYFEQRYPSNAVIVHEDLDWHFKGTGDVEGQIVRLARMLSLVRRESLRQVWLMTAHEPASFPEQSWHRIAGLFSHFVLFGAWQGLEKLLPFSKSFCYRVQKHTENNGRFDYLVVDRRTQNMAGPCSNQDASLLLKVLREDLTRDDTDALSVKGKLNLVVEILKHNPHMKYKDIAEQLGCSVSWVTNLVRRAKMLGFLDPDYTYGATGGRRKGYQVSGTTKKQKILQLREEHSDWTYRQIAEEADTTKNYVRKVISLNT